VEIFLLAVFIENLMIPQTDYDLYAGGFLSSTLYCQCPRRIMSKKQRSLSLNGTSQSSRRKIQPTTNFDSVKGLKVLPL
jgi:hypothetical protein